MEIVAQSLIPVFLLIVLGYFFKKVKFPSDEFWPYMDKFTYYVLFPSLLIYKLSNASLQSLENSTFIFTGIFGIILISVVTIIFNKIFNYEASSFTSIFQGSTRFNTYVFLALVGAVLGDDGIVMAAILMTFAIPFLNFLCIMIFSIYIKDDSFSVKNFIKNIVSNPLIVACFIGGFLNYFQIELGVILNNSLQMLSLAALPMGLLSVGVGLELKSINIIRKDISIPVVLKLVLFPILMFTLGRIFSLDELSVFILVLFASMPTASSSYILARQLGGNVKLMSSIITIQTLGSIFSITAVLYLLNF